uniref:Uncharacterized protein n=1 Tax=Strongyloides papillosus TaxID=174720 RepID=A0A0N5BIR5_STREA
MKYFVDISLNFTLIFIAPNGSTNYMFIRFVKLYYPNRISLVSGNWLRVIQYVTGHSFGLLHRYIPNDITKTIENSIKSPTNYTKIFDILCDSASTMNYSTNCFGIEASKNIVTVKTLTNNNNNKTSENETPTGAAFYFNVYETKI